MQGAGRARQRSHTFPGGHSGTGAKFQPSARYGKGRLARRRGGLSQSLDMGREIVDAVLYV